MATIIEKILARKNQTAKTAVARPPALPTIGTDQPEATLADPSSPAPCPTCGSAIRWLNAAGVPRCMGCQPPKFAALVRSREILAIRSQSPGDVAWERLLEAPDGRLLSESGIRELAATGGLPDAWKGLRPHALTAAIGGGIGIGGDGSEGGGVFGDAFAQFVEIDPDAYFKPAEFFADYLANDRKWFIKPGSAKLRNERQESPAAKRQAVATHATKQKLIQ